MAHRYLILFFAAPLLAQEFHNPVVIPNSGRTDRGTLEFRTANDQRGVKLRSASSMAGDYTMDLPDALGASGDCLKLIATSVLGFGACGSGGGWTLTGDELSPVDTTSTLRLIRATNGQGIGSWAKPWSGMFSTTFQAPNASGTDAKMTLNGSSLTGADTAGNTTISMLFNSGFVSISGTFRGNGIVGQDTDVLHVLKNATLGSNNWRWALSHRADGRQLWFYGYDGTNFSIPLKMNPTGNSVCVNCPGDATAGYSLDVGGQALVTGLRASGAGGYVNAAQIEHRDNSTGLHFGWNANISTIVGIPGAARYVTLQDASSNPIIRMYSHVNGPASPRVQVHGDLVPDIDTSSSTPRLLGLSNRRWREGHMGKVVTSELLPPTGGAGIVWNGHLLPNGTVDIGAPAGRTATIYTTNLDVSGTCTGCGGGSGNWTLSGSALYPTSNTSTLEVLPNPTASPASQKLGSRSAPWANVVSKAIEVPNVSGTSYRVNISSDIILANASGVDTTYVHSSSGNVQNIGGYFTYNTLSDFNPVVSLTNTVFKHTAYAGSGNASLCVDATGQMYRGTPGC